MSFHRTGDLHRCQHEATGCVDHEIDRYFFRRFFDRCNDRLGSLQIDVPSDGKAKKAALLLPMIIVITRDPCDLSIARIACARLRVYHRPVNKGCSTMIAKNIQMSDERSNAIIHLDFVVTIALRRLETVLRGSCRYCRRNTVLRLVFPGLWLTRKSPL